MKGLFLTSTEQSSCYVHNSSILSFLKIL